MSELMLLLATTKICIAGMIIGLMGLTLSVLIPVLILIYEDITKRRY